MENVLSIITSFLSSAWGLFSIRWPGLDLSVGAIFLGLASISISIGFLGSFFGVGRGGTNYRSGKGGKSHGVSEERKKDEK